MDAPKDLTIQIDTSQGKKPFTTYQKAKGWFRSQHPSGQILTEMISAEPPIFKASIWVDGICIATAHAAPEGNTKTFRKVESAAVRRALSNAGFGTEEAVTQLAKDIGSDRGKEMLGAGKNRRMNSQSPKTDNGKQEEVEPESEPAPTKRWTGKPLSGADLHTFFARAENNLTLSKGDVKRLLGLENIEDLSEWERKFSTMKEAGDLLMSAHEAEMAASKPATPKHVPAAEPAPADFLEKITYTPKIVSSGSATVPETSFLHKTNVGKVKAAVQQFYMDGEKLNTFHMNGSICKYLNTDVLKVEMDVNAAIATITQMKEAEASLEAKGGDNVPF